MYLYYLYHFRQVSRSRSENNTSLNKVYEYEKQIQVAEINKPHVSTRHNTCFILQFRVVLLYAVYMCNRLSQYHIKGQTNATLSVQDQ